MESDKYYFICYYQNDSKSMMNVIMVGLHPIEWLCVACPVHPVSHLISWQEITENVAIKTNEKNYIPFEDWRDYGE